MVLFLNYLPWIIAVLGVYATFKCYTRKDASKRIRSAAISFGVTLVALVLLQGLTAGYIPKVRSSETKIEVTEFEPAEGEMQDRLRSPTLTPEAREARLNQMTDWKQQQRDEKVKANTPPPTEAVTPEATQ